MSANRSIYEQVILEHNKKPRNFRAIDDADRKVEGYNPLCGDHFTIYLKMDGDIIEDISFEGSGCAISKSSASIMTSLLKGKTRKDASKLFTKLHHMVMSEPDSELDENDLGHLMAFAGIRNYPMRVKCATLAWHTMLNALEGKEDEPVSTE